MCSGLPLQRKKVKGSGLTWVFVRAALMIIYLVIDFKFLLCFGPDINSLRLQHHVNFQRRLGRCVCRTLGSLLQPPLPPSQTDYFHLFLCVAIIVLYGEDVTEQQLATDQMLLHFSNLSMHMNGELVLRKVALCTRRLFLSWFFSLILLFLQDALTFVMRVCSQMTSARCARAHTHQKNTLFPK